MKERERNSFIDIIRGLAMLLVILGHTMTGCTTGSEASFLFSIVWSLQMPLFVLISGYVTRYSRKISSSIDLWRFLKRRTLAYILPWFIWSFLVRGVFLGQYHYLDIKWLLWHMDSGYWFLVTIWTINIVYCLSTFLAHKIAKTYGLKLLVLTTLFYLVAMGGLAGIGFVVGMSFFAIKLTLYYMPYFFIGYLYGQYKDGLFGTTCGKTVKDAIAAVCLVIWLFIITRYHLFYLADAGMGIVIRVLSSLTGCIAVLGLCKAFYDSDSKYSTVAKFFSWCGIHSIEIYLSHNYFLSVLQLRTPPEAGSILGTGIIAANYLITVLLVVFVVKMLNANRVLRFILYGKDK